ncbi:MAG TPA: hypothetical protein VKQ10_08575, partial [Spirochaetota bacterium]|nr:hypothetical protein [Spirochaetota bacterium]
MKKALLIILAACVILSCRHNIHTLQSSSDTNDLIIWAHSDIQSRNNSQKQHYEIAFNDVKKNFS